MEILALKKVIEEVEKNRKVALVTVRSVKGVAPSKKGMIMTVCKDGTTVGTVGGGGVELEITNQTLEQLESGHDKSYKYKTESVEVKVFIKIFQTREKLLIVGAGHVGFELYQIAKLQKFYVAIVDERVELANAKRFKKADEILTSNIEEVLKNYNIDDKCYIVACGPTHAQDEMTIRLCIDRGAKYLGMLGSRSKIKTIKENLIVEGISSESLESIYAPIGINTGGDSVSEIAFGIFGEILSVKNNSQINHVKDIKK